MGILKVSGGRKLNGRYVYHSPAGGDTFALWWVKGMWFVGDVADEGKRAGFLMASDDSYYPEHVGAGKWHVHTAGGWTPCADVSVIAARRNGTPSDDAPTPVADLADADADGPGPGSNRPAGESSDGPADPNCDGQIQAQLDVTFVGERVELALHATGA